MQFAATYIEPTPSETLASLVLANEENPDEPAYLALTRATEFEDSAYHFEVNDQSNSSYEGLASVRLSRTSLVVKLEPDKAEELGNPDFATIKVEFDADDATFAAIKETLRQVFKGFDILKVA
ncbi:MAG: Imm10 family immunity protein [Meiothermus sp.]|nr:Imm10 family immunity protein [Meiothermus sp.]